MTTETENILNVSELEPRMKHPTIFARFDELNGGESLVIHNDHDPKPLYYQMLGERGNVFTWQYHEEGPERWVVEITKNKEGEDGETLGEIAAKDLRKVEVFKKFGLDFCCGGKKTLKEACAEKGLDVQSIQAELDNANTLQATARPIPYNEWELDFLADYITNTHHSYVRKSLPEITKYASKVMQVHGAEHPELKQINVLVEAINDEMTEHMMKEENVLFPFIKSLVKPTTNEFNPVRSIQNPISMMELEHESVGQNMATIRALSNGFTLPADACASYTLLYNMLQEFEADLHVHIHAENNILFPKALALEKTMK